MSFRYVLLLVALSSTLTAQRPHRRIRTFSNNCIRHIRCSELTKGKATIFVHGTTFPGISRLLLHNPKRRGMYRYTFGPTTGRERLAKVLHDEDAVSFPGESFYKFYWSGHLGFEDRKKAAKDLLQYIQNHQGEITLIAHSHGCNVALYLSQLSDTLSIDRLILLAPPVQQATENFVHSPVFKKVYSFYSSGDIMQVADPQGMYSETKKNGHTTGPFFSTRTYKKGANLIQTRVLFDRRSLGHREFIMPRFMRRIPQLLAIADTAHAKGTDHNIVNIPRYPHMPQLLTADDVAGGYVPRRVKSCTCHGEKRLFA